MLVLLHNIRSAHNVGSIFRTADAAGIEKIYLCGITPAPIDRFGKPRQEIAKVALGAESTVPWEISHSTVSLLKKLKKQGFMIYAIEQSVRSMPYNTMRLHKKELARTVLVVGNEVEGLSSSILTHADTILEIPMSGGKESLNVAVAFGIVAFHLLHPVGSRIAKKML
ncbi:MAG: TrmH family RNA methyltransferase [Candidatus Azambacteria bacterium]|nr:TrmH family RNA methyltransferase [Candidatus Azambacteria bacterium]